MKAYKIIYMYMYVCVLQEMLILYYKCLHKGMSTESHNLYILLQLNSLLPLLTPQVSSR